MTLPIRWPATGLFLFVLAAAAYWLCAGTATSEHEKIPPLVETPEDVPASAQTRQVEESVHSSLETSMSAAYLPSLEMRENADFIISPALLVQDWIDQESVVTYPQE